MYEFSKHIAQFISVLRFFTSDIYDKIQRQKSNWTLINFFEIDDFVSI